jgi:hypothetical protein
VLRDLCQNLKRISPSDKELWQFPGVHGVGSTIQGKHLVRVIASGNLKETFWTCKSKKGQKGQKLKSNLDFTPRTIVTFLKAINKYVEIVSILWPITHMRKLTFFWLLDFFTCESEKRTLATNLIFGYGHDRRMTGEVEVLLISGQPILAGQPGDPWSAEMTKPGK